MGEARQRRAAKAAGKPWLEDAPKVVRGPWYMRPGATLPPPRPDAALVEIPRERAVVSTEVAPPLVPLPVKSNAELVQELALRSLPDSTKVLVVGADSPAATAARDLIEVVKVREDETGSSSSEGLPVRPRRRSPMELVMLMAALSMSGDLSASILDRRGRR